MSNQVKNRIFNTMFHRNSYYKIVMRIKAILILKPNFIKKNTEPDLNFKLKKIQPTPAASTHRINSKTFRKITSTLYEINTNIFTVKCFSSSL